MSFWARDEKLWKVLEDYEHSTDSVSPALSDQLQFHLGFGWQPQSNSAAPD